MTDTSSRIDLATFFRILRQRWLTIVAAGLLAAALALTLSLIQHDKYQASADLLFQKDDFDTTLFGSPATQDQTAPERESATNLELASLPDVAENVQKKLNTPLTVRQLQDRVSTAPKGQADLVRITATGSTPAEAVLLANTFASEAVKLRRDSAQQKVQRAIDALKLAIQQGGTQAQTSGDQNGVSLRDRLDQLTALKVVQTGDVEVVQKATLPNGPSSPKPLRNTIIGFVLGIVLGIFGALLLNRLDRRVRDEDELSRLAAAPVLARVPVARRAHPQHRFEALQFLRANLQLRDPTGETQILAITSALPGDGKTSISTGLAEGLALSGHSVIVVDCDLRKPTLHEAIGVEAGPGVTDVLVDLADPEELLRPARPNLQVLTAGTVALDPGAIVLALQRLPQLLSQLRTLADYIIIDTPPISVAADASTIAASADGTILVVDGNRTRRDVISAAHDQLMHVRAKVLGIVLNRASASVFGAEYGSYRGAEPSSRSSRNVEITGRKR